MTQIEMKQVLPHCKSRFLAAAPAITTRGLVLILSLLLWITNGTAAEDESPRDFVSRFYAFYKTWGIRGVPEPKYEKLISPFFGKVVMDVFRRVNEQRHLWQQKYPFDPANAVKPPWCAEGDVFCGVWEGVTHFAIGKTSHEEGRTVVEAQLKYAQGTESYRWTDRVVLERAGKSWVISDILYKGKESMVKTIDDQLKENAKFLNRER